MRRILPLFILMLLVVISFTSCGSSTKDGSEGLELTLNTKTDTYAVTGIGDCTDTDIIIPNTYMEKAVTGIGDFAFESCEKLTSITIPDSVTSIGDSAFRRCTSLTSITVDEDNVAYKSIDGDLYTKDGKTLIQYAIGKKDTSFVIPNSVTNIASDAFLRCTNLASVTVPSGVISIGVGAFYGCKSLTSVTIPSSVTSIGKSAFYDCKSLIIYCEASSKPNGWESTWNHSNCPVFWGHAHTYENGKCVCGKTE